MMFITIANNNSGANRKRSQQQRTVGLGCNEEEKLETTKHLCGGAPLEECSNWLNYCSTFANPLTGWSPRDAITKHIIGAKLNDSMAADIKRLSHSCIASIAVKRTQWGGIFFVCVWILNPQLYASHLPLCSHFDGWRELNRWIFNCTKSLMVYYAFYSFSISWRRGFAQRKSSPLRQMFDGRDPLTDNERGPSDFN